MLNGIDAGPQDLVRAVLATLDRLFHTVLVAPPEGPAGNHVRVASDSHITLGDIDPAEGAVVSGPTLAHFVGSAGVLRDDHSPANQLLARAEGARQTTPQLAATP